LVEEGRRAAAVSARSSIGGKRRGAARSGW